MSYQSINPNDGKIIKMFTQMSDIQLESANPAYREEFFGPVAWT